MHNMCEYYVYIYICRFHDLEEFDDTKRSCRRRLAGHNERRRRMTSSETNAGDGSN